MSTEPLTEGGVSVARGKLPRCDGGAGSHATAEDGTRIYFETFSARGRLGWDSRREPGDPPPVLSVMGLGANGRLWAPAVRRLLEGGYDVIAIDNRGCGRSSTPWRPWTTRTMASDAVAVLDELGVERAHVGSASLGGMVAQELALEYPERVSSVVLGATTGGLPRLDLASRRGLQIVVEAGVRSLQPASDPDHRVRDWLCTAVSDDFAAECRQGDEAWETVAAMLEDPVSPRGLALQVLAALRHSSWSRLPRLGIPVQVHHGTEDPLIPFSAGRELARRIPGAEFVVHEGAGHALILERPEECWLNIRRFLGQCERA
ncbi:MAG TPA: alpha/beta hydrolase [Thermoleophilaceae bacterium]|nr:alpha/beta hydrolase [Thermoleophilaceae bacterium]